MRYQLSRNDDVSGASILALTISGDVDVSCARQLQNDIENMLESGCHTLVLDLSGVLHLDSYSLGTFLALRDKVRRQGGTVGLVCRQPSLLRLFRITNLDRLFRFYDSIGQFAAQHTSAGV
jgi:anti-sigma B factor antagonist